MFQVIVRRQAHGSRSSLKVSLPRIHPYKYKKHTIGLSDTYGAASGCTETDNYNNIVRVYPDLPFRTESRRIERQVVENASRQGLIIKFESQVKRRMVS